MCVCGAGVEWFWESFGVSPSFPLCPVLTEVMVAKVLATVLQPQMKRHEDNQDVAGPDTLEQPNQRQQLHSSRYLLM